MDERKYYLNFLYNKIAVPKMTMVYWLSLPEFSSEVSKHVAKNNTINDKLIYSIIKDIYFPHKKKRDEFGSSADDFDHHRTRKGLRCLSKQIFNDESYWEKEYYDYLMS